MMAYLSILRIQISDHLQYRTAALARLCTNIFWGFVRAVMLVAFFRYGHNAGSAESMTMSQAVTYVWLGQIVMMLMPRLSVDGTVREKIRTGDVGVELCRPLDLYTHWFARAAAAKLGPFFMQIAPVATVAMLVPGPFNMAPPASIEGFLLCVVSLTLSLLLACATMGIVYVMLMNVSWGDGPPQIMITFIEVLSGAYLPLQLWPTGLQRFLLLQPFAGIMDIPLRLYVGTLEPGFALPALMIQSGWIVMLVIVGRSLMNRSLTNTVIQGG